MKNKAKILYFLPFAMVVMLFIALPLLSIFVQSVREPAGGFGFEQYVLLFKNQYYMMGIKNSLYCTILSILISLPICLIASHIIFKNKTSRLATIVTMASNFQGIPLAFSYMLLLGHTGILVNLGETFGLGFLSGFNLYSRAGILATFVYFQIPLGVLMLYPSFGRIKEEYRDAADVLGAAQHQFWKDVAFPLLRPSILGVSVILFANGLAAYATPYALLGSNYSLFAVQMSSMFVGDLMQNVQMGSAMSVLMLFFTGSAAIISRMLQNKGGAND